MAAIFGPRSHVLASHINNVCATLEIPHIEVRPDVDVDEDRHIFSINVFPDPVRLNRAFLDVVNHFHWNKLCIVYSDTNGQNLPDIRCYLRFRQHFNGRERTNARIDKHITRSQRIYIMFDR